MGYNVTTPSLVLKGEAPQNAHVFHVLNAKKIQDSLQPLKIENKKLSR